MCGGSGSGKTTLARAVVNRFGPNRARSISFDSYYHDLSHMTADERAMVNFDAPPSLDVDLLTEHLEALREGREVAVPAYDFATHTRSGDLDLVPPTDFVIIDGILLFAFPEIRNRLDLRIFLDCPPDVRFERRLQRDVEQRGRTPESVRRQWNQTVEPMHKLHVDPHSRHAHLIVDYDHHLPDTADTVVAMAVEQRLAGAAHMADTDTVSKRRPNSGATSFARSG